MVVRWVASGDSCFFLNNLISYESSLFVQGWKTGRLLFPHSEDHQSAAQRRPPERAQRRPPERAQRRPPERAQRRPPDRAIETTALSTSQEGVLSSMLKYLLRSSLSKIEAFFLIYELLYVRSIFCYSRKIFPKIRADEIRRPNC